MPSEQSTPGDSADRYLSRLGQWRSRKPRYSDLRFLRDQFRRDIEKPHRQIGQLAELWQSHVPPNIVQRTKLLSFQRHTLHVAVLDSSTRYQLDRALRGGVEAELRAAFQGNLRAIKVRVDPAANSTPPPRRP